MHLRLEFHPWVRDGWYAELCFPGLPTETISSVVQIKFCPGPGQRGKWVAWETLWLGLSIPASGEQGDLSLDKAL